MFLSPSKMWPCGKAIENRSHVVGECQLYREVRDVLEETRKIDQCDMEKFGTLDGSEKTIAIPGGRR